MKRRPMPEDATARAVEGRRQAKAVSSYLTYLRAQAASKGRPRTLERVDRDLERTLAEVDSEDPLKALLARQRVDDLTRERGQLERRAALTASMEDRFVEAAASYSQAKGIGWSAWRRMGVPARVLKRAGIQRGSGGGPGDTSLHWLELLSLHPLQVTRSFTSEGIPMQAAGRLRKLGAVEIAEDLTVSITDLGREMVARGRRDGE